MRGHGTILQMSDMAASPAFTAIAEVTNIKPPGITRPFEDNSTHDTVDLVDKIASPLGDQTNMTLRLKWDADEATHDHTTGVLKAARDGNIRDFRVLFTSGAQWDISGYVVSFEFEDIVQGQATVHATLEILPAALPTIS